MNVWLHRLYLHQIDEKGIVGIVGIEVRLFDPIDENLQIAQIHSLHADVLPNAACQLSASTHK